MQTNDAQNILATLLDDAKAAGAEAADAVMYSSISHSVSWRLGKLEDTERAENRDLGLRVLIGQQQAFVATTDHSRDALKELAERCTDMAKAAPADPYCGLADQAKLARAPFADLDLGDYLEPSSDSLMDKAKNCEEAALAVEGVANSGGASASYGEGQKWYASSHGFFGQSGGASHSASVSVIAQDENGMERDYEYDSKTHAEDMMAEEEIGRRAGENAVKRLSPRRVKSQSAPVIFDKRLAPSLVGSVAGAANGGAIARGVSFLKDKLGEQIFADHINIIDDPHIKRGAGSRPFDGEGVANSAFNLIENGRLTQWYLNTSQAKQLGLESNGRATRGSSGAPGSGATNLYMEAGSDSPEALMKDAGTGLLLAEMFGPQVNSNTGDFSVGCAGYWFENGEIAYPVSEITVAGNLLEMFAALVPANDLEFRGAVNAPSLLIPTMTIAGD